LLSNPTEAPEPQAAATTVLLHTQRCHSPGRRRIRNDGRTFEALQTNKIAVTKHCGDCTVSLDS
jgi:hypothetical protein